KRSRLAVAAVVLLGLLVLAVAGGAGYLTYQRFSRGTIPDSDWVEFTPPDGGCHILMPGRPRTQTPRLSAPGVVNPSGDTVQGRTEDTAFFLIRATRTKEGTATPFSAVYAMEREAILGSFEGTLREERDIALGGHPGKEFHAALSEGKLLLVRMYLVRGGSS